MLCRQLQTAVYLYAGNAAIFVAAAGLYAMSNACVGATPVAYASDVMPSGLGGFGLGIYRCAGDLGEILLVGRLLVGLTFSYTAVVTDRKHPAFDAPILLFAGLMLGPAFLGWVADMSSVQTALCVNAVILLAVVAFFGMRAEETHK